MTGIAFRKLAILSITNPAEGARALISLSLPREVMWTALLLVAVLNAFLFTISNMLTPSPSPMPDLFLVPLVYGAFVVGGLVLTVYALFWVGRMLGGQGRLDDVMVVVIWLQALRVLLQPIILLLMIVFPLLSVVLVFAAFLYGMYMLLHFIDQAHQLNSLRRSAVVLFASVLAIALGLALMISLFGGTLTGSSPYV